MSRKPSTAIVHVKRIENRNGSQTQQYLTVRELYNNLYSLVLSGHGDDTVKFHAKGADQQTNPILLGVARANGVTEVWVSDTDDVL